MAQLCRHRKELEELGVSTAVISFGEERWARVWLEETGSPFPLLLDHDREVYRLYGLERSVLRVWSPKVIWYYLRSLLKGKKLPPIMGDPHQLGGDFIVDRDRIVRFAHPSRDPTDRPPVDLLLARIRQLRQQVEDSPVPASGAGRRS